VLEYPREKMKMMETEKRYNRRVFLKGIGLGAAGITLGGCSGRMRAIGRGKADSYGKGSFKRPNIIFIMSDDHAAASIGCYGGFLSKVVNTPNLDRLAREGMRFDNCFCTNSICTPSRANLLTGKYSHKNGVLTLSDSFDGGQVTFPKLLQRAGYDTAMVGKWHLKTEPTGFDYYNVLPGQGDYFNPRMKEKGKLWQDHRKGGEVYQGYVSDVITDVALDYLKNKRDKSKPFMLMCHHKAPHDEWEYAQRYENLYSDVNLPEPPTLFDDYSTRGEALKRCTQKIGMRQTVFEEQTKHLSGDARKKLQYQIYIKKYLRCAQSIDDNIERVLDWLDSESLTDDTVVIYTSDQGYFLGEHGLFDKRFMYEDSLVMPFIVRYPREIKPSSLNDDLVNNVDFAETILDFAGVDIPADMQGRSLRPLLNGKTPENWRDVSYYRYWMHGAHFNVAAHFGIRTKRYKLIYYYGDPLGAKGTKGGPTEPEWELFDLEKDPLEMVNVYGDAAYAGVLKNLKFKLARVRHKVADTDIGFE